MELREVEELARQLEPRDRLRLAAGICEQLGAIFPDMESQDSRRARRLAVITRCDALADGPDDEYDSADDLRRIRAQRIADIS